MGDGARVVPEMMKSFRFDHVFYTGSTRVGKMIYELAASQLVTVTLELGGKSPCIIEKDADLAVAARRVALGKFANTGQTCIAPDYLLVHSSCKNEFEKLLKDAIIKFYSPDPSSSYEYGKIINEKQFDRLVGLLDEGNIIFGGYHNRATLYFSPTIIDEVSLDHRIMKEEIFGPILPIISFNTTPEAIVIVQRKPNPLALYLFTKAKKNERLWINSVRFGGGCINNTDWHFTNAHLPFGGVGESGIGSYHGKYSFETFTRQKSVMKTPNWFDPDIKYPPLKGKMKLFKWFFK
jgi:aldehyde dehydrogenase (NAD+)